MIVRKLDENGDIVTSGSKWATDQECIAQTIKTRLRLLLGEYFRDVTDGMPWFRKRNGEEGILGKGFSFAQVESIIRKRIHDTEGVLKLLSFNANFSVETRKLSIRCQVLTKFGRRFLQWEF